MRDEAHLSEIATTLLDVSEARQRAEHAIRVPAKDEAEPHRVGARRSAKAELTALHERLLPRTYLVAPATQPTL